MQQKTRRSVFFLFAAIIIGAVWCWLRNADAKSDNRASANSLARPQIPVNVSIPLQVEAPKLASVPAHNADTNAPSAHSSQLTEEPVLSTQVTIQVAQPGNEPIQSLPNGPGSFQLGSGGSTMRSLGPPPGTESGAQPTVANSITITDNGDGTETVTRPDGTTQIIAKRARPSSAP